MSRTKLPVLWGNWRWIEDAKGRIRPTERIGKNYPKWIDYSKAPNTDTCFLRKPPYEHHRLRVKFTDQIINEAVKEHAASVAEHPFCYFTCGGTASGKTTAIDVFMEVSEKEGEKHIRIDYDRFKRCLPEYEEMRRVAPRLAAHYCHIESSKMAGKIFKKACQANYNIVYEKTISDPVHTLEEIRRLRRKGYTIAVIGTHVVEPVGQARALKRFHDGGRYVPTDVIRDTYQNVPASLVVLRDVVDDLVLFDNNGSRMRPILVKGTNGVSIIDNDAYSAYVEVVGSSCSLI